MKKYYELFLCVLVLVLSVVATICYASRIGSPNNFRTDGVDVGVPYNG